MDKYICKKKNCEYCKLDWCVDGEPYDEAMIKIAEAKQKEDTEMLSRNQIYYARHTQEERKRGRDNYYKNRDHAKERQRAYYQKNKEKCAAQQKAWKQEHKSELKYQRRKRYLQEKSMKSKEG